MVEPEASHLDLDLFFNKVTTVSTVDNFSFKLIVVRTWLYEINNYNKYLLLQL